MLHTLPAVADDVSITEPPWQNDKGPDAVTVGVPAATITDCKTGCPLPQVLVGVTVMVCVPAAVQLMVAEVALATIVPPPDKTQL